MPLLTDPFDDTPPDPVALNSRWTEKKADVRAVSTVDVVLGTLAPASVIDGVTLVEGDRVLLAGQTDPIECGIYEITGVGNQRAADCDEDHEITAGFYVDVEEGTVGAGKRYRLTTTPPVEVGTDAMAFSDSGTAPDGIDIPTSRSGSFDNTPPDPIE